MKTRMEVVTQAFHPKNRNANKSTNYKEKESSKAPSWRRQRQEEISSSHSGQKKDKGNKIISDQKSTPSKNLEPRANELWDLPTSLTAEEKSGLSQREMFELERQKFLTLREQQSTVNRPSSFHAESDEIMDDLKAEQEQQDTFSPKESVQSDSLDKLPPISVDEMQWLGDMLKGDVKENLQDEDLFCQFFSSSITASSSSSSTVSDGKRSSSFESNGKSSRLGSILGIQLSPHRNGSEVEFPKPSNSANNIGESVLGADAGLEPLPSAVSTENRIFENIPFQEKSKKSRDLLSALGFSPQRNQPSTQSEHSITISNTQNFVFQNSEVSPSASPSPHLATTGSVDASSGKESNVRTPSSAKRVTMSASSRMQLQRMKQSSGNKKKTVTSTVEKTSPQLSHDQEESISTRKLFSANEDIPSPDSLPKSQATPNPPKCSTNSKGAALLKCLNKKV